MEPPLARACSHASREESGTAAPAAAASSSATAAREGQIITREAFVGLDELVDLADGTQAVAINFDNGATTPSLVSALDTFGQVGFDAIAEHEQRMLRKTIDGLATLAKVTVYGDTQDIADKVGVITFNVEGVEAADVAKQLAEYRGVAVRQGEFCAHPYCHRLLGVPDEEIVAGMRTTGFAPPAMVRISFGMYNDESEVDAFLAPMSEIAGQAAFWQCLREALPQVRGPALGVSWPSRDAADMWSSVLAYLKAIRKRQLTPMRGRQMLLHGTARHGTARHGTARHGTAR